jgi:hypothetical protein
MSAAKDDPSVQRPRLEKAAKELDPGYEVEFRDAPFVEMIVVDPKTRKVLYASPDRIWLYAQLADKRDHEIKDLLRQWREASSQPTKPY